MRRNRYDAVCSHCRVRVMASFGRLDWIDGRAVVRHDWCADLDRPRDGAKDNGAAVGSVARGTDQRRGFA